MVKALTQGKAKINIPKSNLQPAEFNVKPKEKIKIPKTNKGALKKLDRQLTDDELRSIAVSKLLLDKIDTLDAEVKESKTYVENYHKLNVDCAVLKKELKIGKKFKFLNESCLTIGGALFGLAFTFQDIILRAIMILFSLILVFIGWLLSFLLDKDE